MYTQKKNPALFKIKLMLKNFILFASCTNGSFKIFLKRSYFSRML